jgi:uncharacterized Zn-finger protein
MEKNDDEQQEYEDKSEASDKLRDSMEKNDDEQQEYEDKSGTNDNQRNPIKEKKKPGKRSSKAAENKRVEQFECPCGKKFNSKRTLANHKRTHTSSGFKCETCDKCFTQKFGLDTRWQFTRESTMNVHYVLKLINRNTAYSSI